MLDPELASRIRWTETGRVVLEANEPEDDNSAPFTTLDAVGMHVTEPPSPSELPSPKKLSSGVMKIPAQGEDSQVLQTETQAPVETVTVPHAMIPEDPHSESLRSDKVKVKAPDSPPRDQQGHSQRQDETEIEQPQLQEQGADSEVETGGADSEVESGGDFKPGDSATL